MAITTGKAQVKSEVEAKLESIKPNIISTFKDADDIMKTITDPAQNEAKRLERYAKMYDAIKQAVVDSLDQFFDSYSDNIKNNAQVNTGIALSGSGPGGSITGSTTAPGVIS